MIDKKYNCEVQFKCGGHFRQVDCVFFSPCDCEPNCSHCKFRIALDGLCNNKTAHEYVLQRRKEIQNECDK